MSSEDSSKFSLPSQEEPTQYRPRRRAYTYNEAYYQKMPLDVPKQLRKRTFSFDSGVLIGAPVTLSTNVSTTETYRESTIKANNQNITLPPRCTCPYFGESSKRPFPHKEKEVVIVSSENFRSINKSSESGGLLRNPRNESKNCDVANSVVTWTTGRRGSMIGRWISNLISNKSFKDVMGTSYISPKKKSCT